MAVTEPAVAPEPEQAPVQPDVPTPSEWPQPMKDILDELELLKRAKDLVGGSSVTDAGHSYQISQDLLVGLEHGLKKEFADRLVGETRKSTKAATGHDWDPYAAI